MNNTINAVSKVHFDNRAKVSYANSANSEHWTSF